jgi:hypothetical protein
MGRPASEVSRPGTIVAGRSRAIGRRHLRKPPGIPARPSFRTTRGLLHRRQLHAFGRDFHLPLSCARLELEYFEAGPQPRVHNSGRLPRRSPEQIAKALDWVIALLKGKEDGLRAEQIRAALKMQSKEMPRVLQEGLAKKKLKAKGQKRATTYTATRGTHASSLLARAAPPLVD